MRLREFYNHFLNELKPLYDYEEAAAVSNMIFEHFAGKSRADIISYPDDIIDKEKIPSLENALLQLKRNVPVQYVIGHTWFAGLVFKVNTAVLIPRPETEELVNEAIKYILEHNKKTVLDIGTGSGCIPVSIKKKLPGLSVSAIDISEDAIEVAKENALQNGVDVEFTRKNFLLENEWAGMPQYDIIISNPPYIPENEKDGLDKNVTLHEPHLALFVPDNQALIFYEKIALFGLQHLAPGGAIFMETHESFAGAVAHHFFSNGYDATVQEDIFGKDRMVIASRSHSP